MVSLREGAAGSSGQAGGLEPAPTGAASASSRPKREAAALRDLREVEHLPFARRPLLGEPTPEEAGA